MKNKNIFAMTTGGMILLSAFTFSVQAQTYEQWKKIGAPTGIKTIISNDNAIFGTTVQDGVFKVWNEGNSAANIGFATPGFSSPLIAEDGDTLYVSMCKWVETGEGGSENAIFKSVDDGDSWSRPNTQLRDSCFVQLAANDGILYASTDSWPASVLKSTDEGRNWSEISSPAGENQIYTLTWWNDGLYLSTQDGLYRSTDDGNTWARIDNDIPTPEVEEVIFDGDNMYAFTYEGIFKSANGGVSWQGINTPDGSHHLAVRNSTLYLAVNENIQRSVDNGAAWIQCGPLTVEDYTAWPDTLFVHGDVLYVGATEGLFKSADGCESWHMFKQDIPSENTVIAATSGVIYAGGSEGYSSPKGISRSADGGLNWVRLDVPFDDYANIVALAAANQTIFAATENAVYKSGNNGDDWKKVLDGVDPLFVALENEKVFVVTSGNIFRSLNGGTSWSSLNFGFGYSDVANIVVKNGVVYVAAYYSPYAFKSLDNGNSWIRLGRDFEFNSSWSRRPLAVLGNDSIYAGDSYDVFKGVNGGTSWEDWVRINPGAGSGQFAGAESLAAQGNIVFLATGEGVYKLMEGTANWVAVNEGLSPYGSPVDSFVFDQDSVYMNLAYQGIFKRPLR